MNIQIICAGRLKEKFFADAAGEYIKRLSRFAKVSVIEVHDEKIPPNAARGEIEKAKDTEAAAMLEKIDERGYIFALCVEGKQLSSEKFAEKIADVMMYKSNITFIIGGSAGLSDKVKAKADFKLSFSGMTFPHQLMRVILLEQVYRGFKIINNENYHK